MRGIYAGTAAAPRSARRLLRAPSAPVLRLPQAATLMTTMMVRFMAVRPTTRLRPITDRTPMPMAIIAKASTPIRSMAARARTRFARKARPGIAAEAFPAGHLHVPGRAIARVRVEDEAHE